MDDGARRSHLARGLLAVLLGAVLAPALVVAGPAGQAAALAAPPAPLAFTGSYVAANTATITLPETAVLSARTGAAAAAAASGATTGGTATAVTGMTVAGGAATALYGLGLGLAIGDGLVRVINLARPNDDQLVPLSDMLISKITPGPGYVPPAPPAGSVQIGTVPAVYWIEGPYSGASKGPAAATFTLTALERVSTDVSGVQVRLVLSDSVGAYNGNSYPYAYVVQGFDVDGVEVAYRSGDSFGTEYRTTVDPPGTTRLGLSSNVVQYRSIASVRVSLVDQRNGTSYGSQTLSVAGGLPSGAAAPRALETRAMCSGVLAAARSASFDPSAADWPPPPNVTCPGAVTPSRVEIWEIVPGTAEETLLSSWDAPALAPDLMPKTGARLDLLKVNPEPAVSCFSAPAGCAQWFADPAKTSNYRCTYGGVTVALSECNVYRPSFDPDARTPYANPAGEVPPASSSAPGGEVVEQDAGDRRCYPRGWSALNPVEWVLRPIRCAFEPRESEVVVATSQIRDVLTTTGPGPLVLGVSGIFGAFDTWSAPVQDCRGPQVAWHQQSSVLGNKAWSLYPFAACEGPVVTVAGYARTFAAVTLWLAALVTGAATVSKAFGLDLPFTAAGGED